MLEDGLRDVKSVNLEEDDVETADAVDSDLENDFVGAKYLRMDNSFQDSIIYTVELPVSDHKRLIITEAKLRKVKNL